MSILLALIPLLFLGAIVYLVYYGFKKYVDNYEQKIITPNFLPLIIIILLAYNILVFETDLGLGRGIATIIFFGVLYFYFPKNKRDFNLNIITISGILAGVFLSWRSNDFLQSLNAFLIFVELVMLFTVYAVEDSRNHFLSLIRGIFAMIFAPFRQVKLLIDFNKEQNLKSKFNILKIVKTVAITVLTTVIFLALLKEADPVFAHFIDLFLGNIGERAFYSFVVTMLIIWFLLIKIKPKHPINTNLSFLSYYDLISPISILLVLFAVFLAIQFKYLFAGHLNITDLDITYSDYVRKGFFELLVTVAIGSFITMIIAFKKDDLNPKQTNILKGANIALMIELMLMIVSATERDIIYIESYGLTRIRVVGALLLIWLVIYLGLILIQTLLPSLSKKIIYLGSISSGLIIYSFLNIVNVDQFIANYNLNKFKPTDVHYLSLLSPDAFASWPTVINLAKDYYHQINNKNSLTDEEKKQMAENQVAIQNIGEQLKVLDQKYDTSKPIDKELVDYEKKIQQISQKWQSMIINEKQAWQFFQDHKNIKNTLTCVLTELQFYQMKHAIDLNTEVNNLSNNYDRPLMKDRYYYYNIWDVERAIFDKLIQNKKPVEEQDKYLNDRVDAYGFDPEKIKALLAKIEPQLNLDIKKISDLAYDGEMFAKFKEILIKTIEVKECNL